MRSTASRLASFAALLLASLPAMAQEYTIKLERPSKVGQKYNLSAKGSQRQSQTVTVGGQQAQQQAQNTQLEFQGVEEVLTINEQGKPTKSSYLVDRCVKIVEGKEEDLIKKGQTVVQDIKDGKAELTIDGKPLPEDVRDLVSVVIPEHDPKAPELDKVFGTSQKQKVGDSWKVDSEAIAKKINEEGKMKADAQNITGAFKLVGVEKVGDIECLRVAGDVTISKIGLPVPADIKAEKAEMTIHLDVLCPTDPTLRHPALAMKMGLFSLMTAKGPEGQQVNVNVSFDRAVEGKQSLVK